MTARDLEVVHLDRDAAADIGVKSLAFHRSYCDAIRRGEKDHHWLVQRLAQFRLAHQPPAACEGLQAMLVDDPNWICSGIPDAVIEAGVDAWGRANNEIVEREASLRPEDLPDWDEGMIVAATFKAMLRAALSSAPVAPVGEGLREALEKEMFTFLSSHYVQRSDARQAEMGLTYTTAETHDLAKQAVRHLLNSIAALQNDGGGK
jgi:hypothetical protein